MVKQFEILATTHRITPVLERKIMIATFNVIHREIGR